MSNAQNLTFVKLDFFGEGSDSSAEAIKGQCHILTKHSYRISILDPIVQVLGRV